MFQGLETHSSDGLTGCFDCIVLLVEVQIVTAAERETGYEMVSETVVGTED